MLAADELERPLALAATGSTLQQLPTLATGPGIRSQARVVPRRAIRAHLPDRGCARHARAGALRGAARTSVGSA